MVYRQGSTSAAFGEDELDAVFSALGHRARRQVLSAIARDGEPPTMKEIAAELGLSPQLLNKHLTALEQAHLITRSRVGRETNAQAHPETLLAASEWITEMTAYWNRQLDSLQSYIDSLEADPPSTTTPPKD